MLRSGTDVVTNVEIYPVSKLNLVIRKKRSHALGTVIKISIWSMSTQIIQHAVRMPQQLQD